MMQRIIIFGAALLIGLSSCSRKRPATPASPPVKKPNPVNGGATGKSATREVRLLHTLQGHRGSIWSVAWSPNGKQIATGSWDHSIKYWNADTGKLLHSMRGHKNRVHKIAWSPDGKHLASCGWDGEIKIWDGTWPKHTLSGHSSVAFCIAWSPDGKRLASGSPDKSVRIWDTENGKLLHLLEGHTGTVWNVAWSPDGKRLASGSNDNTIKIWDAEFGALAQTLTGHEGAVWSTTWNPDGKRLASGSDDRTVRIWDASSGHSLHILRSHQACAHCVTWNRAGDRLASSSWDTTAKVWDPSQGKLLQTLSGHTGFINLIQWSPNDKQLATASDDGTANVWNAETGQLLDSLGGHASAVHSLAWDPNDGRLAVSGFDGKVNLWSITGTHSPPAKPLAPDPTPEYKHSPAEQEQLKNGEAVSKTQCVSCHVRPEPSILSSEIWDLALQRMMPWLGMMPPHTGLASTNGFERVLAANIFPSAPVMSVKQWTDVCYYYIEKSEYKKPITLNPNPPELLQLFAVEQPATPFDAHCMYVNIGAEHLWVAHEPTSTLHRLGSDGKWRKPINPGGSVSRWQLDNTGAWGTLIGSFRPSVNPRGALVRWEQGKTTPLLPTPLHRPADVLPVDLNNDGREDLVVCEYGHLLGSAFWLENTGGKFKRHPLLNQPGSVSVASGHFNDDGIPDFAILTGQAREAVHLFISTGPGEFDHREILPRHPAWGHTHIEILDFNKDGHPDLLITNGDNGEVNPAPIKPYHGVRLHLNDGRNQFREALFYQQPGAFRAVAHDFDGDGDLDIASTAFFADYQRDPAGGFVFLRQDQPLKFTPLALPAADSRWLAMDAGDLDGDGDVDIVLGAYNNGPSESGYPTAIRVRWQANPVPLIILRNRSK